MEKMGDKKFLPDYFKTGLTDEEVKKLTEEGKVNKIKKSKTASILGIILKNVCTFFNLLLITIAVILAVFNQWSNMAFFVILVANLALGLIQDLRAKRMVDKLSVINKAKYSVIRNGKEVELLDDELVVGDIVILRSSDVVPCDSLVLTGSSYLNEALLTGESDKVKKVPGDHLLSGTYLTSGEVYILIEKVGEENYVNVLNRKSKEFKRPKSKLFTQINNIFKVLTIIVSVLGILQILVVCFTNNAIQSGQNITYDLISNEIIAPISGALISMIPSGMYLLFSTTLVAGVIVLSIKKVLVHDMYSLDMLARTDVLCIDKTGTITTGNMYVKSLTTFKDSPFNQNELHLIIANINRAVNDFNTTAVALKNYFDKNSTYKEKSVIHFDSSYKYSGATFEGVGTFIIGAYGFFKCINDNEVLKNKIQEASNNGERILMIAHSKKEIVDETIPDDLKFIGVIIIEDEIKKDAQEILNWFRRNDVKIKILSGDNELTVKNIALKVNLEGAEKCVSLKGKEDAFIEENVENYDVYGRVSPEQKRTIVEALRKNGHTVAMFGDGVNDILAFKSADVSISVANGANAAKDLASLILTDNNFSGLPDIVSQGRRVINNLQRTCSLFLVKTTFSMILNTFFLIFGLCTGITWPFAPASFYARELCSIGIASFLLALEPNSERLKGSFIKNICVNAIPPGIVLSFSIAVFYIVAYSTNMNVNYGFTDDTLRTIATWYISVAAALVLIETCFPFNKYRLFVLGLTIVLIAIMLIWTVYGVNWLKFEGDAPRYMDNTEIAIFFIMLAITLCLLIIIWSIKHYFRIKKIDKGHLN